MRLSWSSETAGVPFFFRFSVLLRTLPGVGGLSTTSSFPSEEGPWPWVLLEERLRLFGINEMPVSAPEVGVSELNELLSFGDSFNRVSNALMVCSRSSTTCSRRRLHLSKVSILITTLN